MINDILTENTCVGYKTKAKFVTGLCLEHINTVTTIFNVCMYLSNNLDNI